MPAANGGLASGAVTRPKFVGIWKFIARASVGESPACRQAAGTLVRHHPCGKQANIH